jgi:hypothetical protein
MICDLNWNAISALASVISSIAATVMAASIVIAFDQLKLTRNISQLQFEDSFSREYRDLISHIPTKALLNGTLTRTEYANSFDDFFRYIDLSNEQVSLRCDNRISKRVWGNWCSGIKNNLELHAFKKAWDEIKLRDTKSFQNLRKLEAGKFEIDPATWSSKI